MFWEDKADKSSKTKHSLFIMSSVDTSFSPELPELEELVGSYRRRPASKLVSSEFHRRRAGITVLQLSVDGWFVDWVIHIFFT